MPDRPDNPTDAAPPGTSPRPEQRVDRIPTHQHLDTDALSAYIDNRLEGDLSLAASGHIETCLDCRRELAELRATASLLHGLPQYRPRRSFALGQEYAHPVRTSRFARFLPLLPKLQAAAVACLLLLVVVGAGDVLTQIGEDSNAPESRSSAPEQIDRESAFQPGAAAGGEVQPDPGAIAGDGTGGETGSAGFAGESEIEPDADTGAASQSEGSSLDQAPAPAGAAPSAGLSAEGRGESGEADTARESESISAASAPDSAESAGIDADTTGADEESQSATTNDDLGEAAIGGAGAAREPAAAADLRAADDAAETSTDGGRSSAAQPDPTTGAGATEPVPTIGISTEAPNDEADGEVAQADASGAADPERQSGSVSDSGISNWRLIEIVLGVVLVVLGALVVALHRLNARARRIGIIR